jgi:hypothetical protein
MGADARTRRVPITPRLRAGGLALGLLLLLAGLNGGVASRAAAPTDAAPVVLTLTANRIARGGGTESMATWSTTLREGESAHTVVASGAAPSGDDCQAVVGTDESVRTLLGDPPLHRGVRVTLLRSEPDAVRFRVEWQERSETHTDELALGESQPHVWAFVPGPATSPCAAVSWSWTAAFAEPADMRGERIDYELWLEQRNPDASRTADRILATGAQGAVVSFAFPELTAAVPGSGCLAATTLSGRLKGRVQADGTIALLVRPVRGVAQRRPDAAAAVSSPAEGGAARVVVPSGEAVRLDIPPPAAEAMFLFTFPCPPLDGRSPAPAPDVFSGFVRQQQVSLTVRAVRRPPVQPGSKE